MRIAALCAQFGHYKPLMRLLIDGMTKCGDEVECITHIKQAETADAMLCWGWRNARRFRHDHPGISVLVMERGYVGDRHYWTSLGWNGLNGRAVFPKARETDCVARYVKEFGQLAPWYPRIPRMALNAYALILGQVQSDQACVNVNLAYQYRAWAHLLHTAGWRVKFRQHPKALRQPSGLPTASYARGTLAEDLAGAAFTVSWNSNSSVDSVLAGVPSVTLDEGAMAWAVTSHDLRNPVTMPSRTEWAAQLAWCQWQPSELSDGTAWKAVREVKP